MKRRKFIENTLLGGGLLLTGSGDANSLNESVSVDDVENVLTYIQSNWKRSVYKDLPGQGFNGVDLPYPYTSPSIKGEGHFTFFFYWDTYFTNLGLLKNGLEKQVKNNIRNMLWLIQEQGYMPNHVGLYNRSQTPYLQMMVHDYFKHVSDESEQFYKECAEGLRKEYQFWMTARYSVSGLNHFGYHEKAEECIKFYNTIGNRRLKLPLDVPDEKKIIIGGNLIAEAESWDFCQRYNQHATEFNAVDLNALLWGYEDFLYTASNKLNWYLKDFYKERAQERRELIDKYLWNDALGWFFDYDFVNKEQSKVYSVSGLQPLFMGIASKEQAEKVLKNLPLLERDYGIATTNERPGCRDYQWAYPVVWPPMVYITVKGLDNYGFKEDARRIAKKFIDVNTALFKEHGKLFEKTNAETGNLSNAEYGSAPMMGWTAGVFVTLVDYLKL
jgi:alpha,alpha-trehalase